MQRTDVIISVEYRSDGPMNKAKVQEAIIDTLLAQDHASLFSNGATYAGYTVSLKKIK
jgi:hypothetical protein